MLKITKGLKKKKKGKKSKRNKEEELFRPEELEAYRREHQAHVSDAADPAVSDSDEWRKFQALTAGVDDVLKKTQGDLDRIKSTSFFQRVKPADSKRPEASGADKNDQSAAGAAPTVQVESAPAPESIGVVPVSESESEYDAEEEDDIFDTSFVDAVASGEVKLAYIPESPTTEEPSGADPFDTSIAERAILGPAYNKKGKKLVPLGAAVEVLTGRVEQVSCVIPRKPSVRRPIKQQDLLLGSFDVDNNGNTAGATDAKPVEASKSLLDDDSLPIPEAPIDLSGASLHQAVSPFPVPEEPQDPTKSLIDEFDVINKIDDVVPEIQDDEDDEFALLAAESVAKKVAPAPVAPPPVPVPVAQPSWDTFEATFEVQEQEEEFVGDNEPDPFDTTFAENILPGKAELKLIEDEILNADLEEFQTNVEEAFKEIIKSKVSIHVTNPTGERESISSLDHIDESCLNSLQTIHRDLLGGSNTDLSKIGDEPITPNQPIDDSFSDYSDPFDTSIVEQVAVPGQAELKFIEKEILGDVTIKRVLSDPDFNPREEEPSEPAKPFYRPDILEVNSVKTVAFQLPSPSSRPDLLATDTDDTGKHTKPLTPYYVRENSLPETFTDETDAAVDPFDTSFVAQRAPGKAELKLIENEFINEEQTLSDEDFDPRKDTEPVPAPQVPLTQPEQPKLTLPLQQEAQPQIDLLAAGEEVSAKVLTPAVEKTPEFDSYLDPFDTSIATNILPGKTELKLLENELICETPLKRNLTDPDFDPRTAAEEEPQEVPNVQDLLEKSDDPVGARPLTPVDYQVSFDIGGDDDIDPFDTSVAENLLPGKAELKILESELI